MTTGGITHFWKICSTVFFHFENLTGIRSGLALAKTE